MTSFRRLQAAIAAGVLLACLAMAAHLTARAAVAHVRLKNLSREPTEATAADPAAVEARWTRERDRQVEIARARNSFVRMDQFGHLSPGPVPDWWQPLELWRWKQSAAVCDEFNPILDAVYRERDRWRTQLDEARSYIAAVDRARRETPRSLISIVGSLLESYAVLYLLALGAWFGVRSLLSWRGFSARITAARGDAPAAALVRRHAGNRARLDPDHGLEYVPRFLRSRRLALSFAPTRPGEAPIGRLLHGSYWMGRATEGVALGGPDPLGEILELEVPAGAAMVVDLAHVVAWSGAGRLATHVAGLAVPACWLLGHPLPVVCHGPMRVFFHGTQLDWQEQAPEGGIVELPSQLVAFPADVLLKVEALEAASPAAAFRNAFSRDTRVVFSGGPVLAASANRPRGGRLGATLRISVHIAGLAALLSAASQYLAR